MDSKPNEGVSITDLGPADLAGAMLRKSFSREPNRTLFARPIAAAAQMLATAGVWPTGMLIWRLWLYASHQRFRAGELLSWLGDPAETHPPAVRRIRPTWLLVAALVAWVLAALALAGLVGQAILAWAGWVDPLPSDPRRSTPALSAAGLIIAASILQIVSVLTVRLRMEQFCRRLSAAEPRLRLRVPDPAIPAWCVWPMLLAVPWAGLWIGGYRWLAWWLMPAIVALLAAEVQRGYITVTDRRLRYAIARRIGFLLPGRRGDR